MTNEEAKQAKIREAWGWVWDKLPPEMQQMALESPHGAIPYLLPDEEGDLNIDNVFEKFGLSFQGFDDFLPDNWSPSCVRPTSLIGIESNNGWKRIAGPEDLPRREGEYNFWFPHLGTYSITTYKFNLKHFVRRATHWRPIEVPPPPVY